MKTYLESDFNNDFNEKRICGIDEAGRGNWAGPMVVAGCVLNKDTPEELIAQLDDSKKLSAEKREALFTEIQNHSSYAIAVIDVKTINELGPKKAAVLGMEKVGKALADACDIYFIDAEHPNLAKPVYSYVKGDTRSINIAAASILAKTKKDALMREFVRKHPEYADYDFIHNQGYGTKKHALALQEHGKILDFHRLNYEPVKKTSKVFKCK